VREEGHMSANLDRWRSIEQLAYSKWEAAGRPDGDGKRFWHDAEREFGERNGGNLADPNDRSTTRSSQPDNRFVRLPWYPEKTPTTVFVFGCVAAFLVLVTFSLAVLSWWSPKEGHPWLTLLAAIWAVSPPIWFWYEYLFLIVNHVDEKQLEKYKFAVQLGAAIWAGVAISLAAYVGSDHFKQPAPDQTLQQTPRP
jgi:hypothetical protein